MAKKAKYEPSGRPLSDYEREVMTIIAEEAAEVAQAACKILRFGIDHKPGRDNNNVDDLSLEVGDLTYMLQLAKENGLLNQDKVRDGMDRKHERLKVYMQNERG